MSWHNATIKTVKAIVIKGIDSTIMDARMAPSDGGTVYPTLREKLHAGGGFITIISTYEKNKWFGISTKPEESKLYVNTILRDLCSTAYSDGTLPVASIPDKRKISMKPADSKERSLLLDTQSKSWADLTRGHTADNHSHSESHLHEMYNLYPKYASAARTILTPTPTHQPTIPTPTHRHRIAT
jgi:hypothetical protein